jgi:predicted membrane-bound mannosyltransferase
MPDRTTPYIEDQETSAQPSPSLSVPLSWLSLEAVLWLLVGLLALWLCGSRLDAAPLRLPEAENSLLAWRFIHDGQRPAADAAYSPALFSGQALFFLLFGAGDAVARLWPALAGLALALTPLLLRRQLGRVAALATGGLLALSPTAVLLSRTATGDVLAALGSFLLVAGLWRAAATRTLINASAEPGTGCVSPLISGRGWLFSPAA